MTEALLHAARAIAFADRVLSMSTPSLKKIALERAVYFNGVCDDHEDVREALAALRAHQEQPHG